MKALVILFLLIFLQSIVQAETLRIATGEYTPYSGEHIPNQGISTMVVKAVFKELKQEIQIDFMPWKRAMNYLNNATVAASFPWTKNTDREKQSYFSAPINKYRILVFTKSNNTFKNEQDLVGKTFCTPSGWDFTAYVDVVKKLKMQIVNPMNVESCFNMLALSRVDVIFMNEMVGQETIVKLFGSRPVIVGREESYLKKRENLYFIVSKKYPNAQKIIENFNRGLAIIKKNGIYDSIVIKANCETCNRLGSL